MERRISEIQGAYVWLRADSGPRGVTGWMSPYSQHQTLASPKEMEHRSLTTLREKPVKIGAKAVAHGHYVTFQLAEVAIPRPLFAEILRLIYGLRPAPLLPGRSLNQPE